MGVRARGGFVQLAAVDLRLLLVIAVDEIGNLVALRHVTVDEEWTVRQSSGEARIRTGRLLRGVVARRQLFCVGRPVAVDLAGGSSRLGEAVSARKIAEQIIETVILQIDDDDVLDPLEPLRPGAGGLRRGGDDDAEGDKKTHDQADAAHSRLRESDGRGQVILFVSARHREWGENRFEFVTEPPLAVHLRRSRNELWPAADGAIASRTDAPRGRASGCRLLLQLRQEVVEVLGADFLELGEDALQAAPTVPFTVVLAAVEGRLASDVDGDPKGGVEFLRQTGIAEERFPPQPDRIVNQHTRID